MSFNQALADRILEFAALEPTIPAGTGHDFYDILDSNVVDYFSFSTVAIS